MRPPGTGLQLRGRPVAQSIHQRPLPDREGGAVNGGEVASQPPPQSRGGLLRRQGPDCDGRGEVLGDGDASSVQSGEAMRQDGGVGVTGEIGTDVAEEIGPDPDGVGWSNPLGEALLPVVRGGPELCGSGGATVGGFYLPGCPPHLHLGHTR